MLIASGIRPCYTSETMRKLEIAPSIIAADLANLGEAIRTSETAGADRFHIDVMDGNFVSNITFGPGTISAIRPLTQLSFDVHLMIHDPDRYLQDFAEAGADTIIAHIEASPDIVATVRSIHKLGKQAGVAISPDTRIDLLRNVVASVDLILVMSVYPGRSGQKFLEKSFARIEEVRRLLSEENPEAVIAIDGGVTPDTVTRAVNSGATNLIAATAIYCTGGTIHDAISQLRLAAERS